MRLGDAFRAGILRLLSLNGMPYSTRSRIREHAPPCLKIASNFGHHLQCRKYVSCFGHDNLDARSRFAFPHPHPDGGQSGRGLGSWRLCRPRQSRRRSPISAAWRTLPSPPHHGGTAKPPGPACAEIGCGVLRRWRSAGRQRERIRPQIVEVLGALPFAVEGTIVDHYPPQASTPAHLSRACAERLGLLQ